MIDQISAACTTSLRWRAMPVRTTSSSLQALGPAAREENREFSTRPTSTIFSTTPTR